MDTETKKVLKKIEKSLSTLAEVSKANERNKWTALEFIKDFMLVFILSIVVDVCYSR